MNNQTKAQEFEKRAIIALRKIEQDWARLFFAKAIATDPASVSPKSYNEYGALLAEQKKYAEALKIFQKGLELCGSEQKMWKAAFYDNIVETLSILGRYDEARMLAAQAIEFNTAYLAELDSRPMTNTEDLVRGCIEFSIAEMKRFLNDSEPPSPAP